MPFTGVAWRAATGRVPHFRRRTDSMGKATRMGRLLTAVAGVALHAAAAPALRLDFEGVGVPGDCGRFDGDVYLASPGYRSKQCVARRSEGTYCMIRYRLPEPLPLRPRSRLRFAHRVLTERKLGYVGIHVFTLGGKASQGRDSAGPQWRVCQVELIGMGPVGHAKDKDPLAAGDRVTSVAVYGRMAEPGELVTMLDDIELLVPGADPITLVPAPATPTVDEEPPQPPRPGELFSFDFELGRRDAYTVFAEGGPVTPGLDSRHAWSVSGNAKFLELHFDCDFVLREDMWLEMDSKVLTDDGHRLYIGLYFLREDNRKRLNSSVASTDEWEQNASRDILLWSPAGHSPIKEGGVVGERYTRGVLYSKLTEAAPQTMVVDNLQLVWAGGTQSLAKPETKIHQATVAETIIS